MKEMKQEDHRVVITGLGAVTPLGSSMATYWEEAIAGKSGVGYITHFDASDCPTRIAGEVRDFEPLDYMDYRTTKRTPRFTQFAIAAVKMALEDAQLDLSREDPTKVGLEMGSAVGGMGLVEEQAFVLKERGPRRVHPSFVPGVLINMAPCQLAIFLGIKGPASSPVAACATGVVAIGEALRRLQRGDVRVMIAGASDSVGSRLGMIALSRLGALSSREDDPQGACRPFDADRDGFVISEGAAVVLMETLEHALKRGAQIYGEVMGYGFTVDGYNLAAPDPTGGGAARAMSLAIEESGLNPADIDHICSHGTGTRLNDVAETKAIKTIFGERAYRIPINSVKSMIGHLLGAAGTISVATALKTIQQNIMPPTINLHTPDPECDLDYVPLLARPHQVRTVLVNAFGLGGQNGSLVVRRFSESFA